MPWSSARHWLAGFGVVSWLAPDDDVLAHRYELVDARLSAAGFAWYEVSTRSTGRRVPAQPGLLGRWPVVGRAGPARTAYR